MMRSGEQFHAVAVAREHLENLARQVGCHRRRRLKIEHRNLTLGGDGFYPADLAGVSNDLGSAALRISRIQHPHRDIAPHRRRDGGRMQNLGAKASQFRRLIETQGGDAPGVGAKIGVRGHDAIHVGPNLDPASLESHPNHGGAAIRSATAQSGGDAFPRGSDESSQHW